MPRSIFEVLVRIFVWSSVAEGCKGKSELDNGRQMHLEVEGVAIRKSCRSLVSSCTMNSLYDADGYFPTLEQDRSRDFIVEAYSVDVSLPMHIAVRYLLAKAMNGRHWHV